MGYDMIENNRVYVSGRVACEPQFSHEILGERFYDFTLGVARLSGQEDAIPVTVSERLITDENELKVGEMVGINGQLRSYNKIADAKSRLVLRVFARDIDDGDADNPNNIELEGYVCKPPMFRTTPFKREITDLLVAVNRAYNKSDYIPAIAWGRNARFASTFEVGDKIKLFGRIQSRAYRKVLEDGTEQERTAYEVSVAQIERLPRD